MKHKVFISIAVIILAILFITEPTMIYEAAASQERDEKTPQLTVSLPAFVPYKDPYKIEFTMEKHTHNEGTPMPYNTLNPLVASGTVSGSTVAGSYNFGNNTLWMKI